jgi:ABC-2 type transport system ATP-binding protein
VQVLGDVDDLLARHKLLIGPRGDPTGLVGVSAVVQASHTDKQTTALVRTDGRFERGDAGRPGHDPRWRVDDLNLEDLVLAYLSAPSAGALPGPSRTDQEVSR